MSISLHAKLFFFFFELVLKFQFLYLFTSNFFNSMLRYNNNDHNCYITFDENRIVSVKF